jgi:hypothetical protein
VGLSTLPRLFQRASVYTENGTDGAYDVLDKADLRCRSTHVGLGNTLAGRMEMARIRRFYFDGEYVMPQDCQIEIDGSRWRPTADIRTIDGTGGNVKSKAVDITEVIE